MMMVMSLMLAALSFWSGVVGSNTFNKDFAERGMAIGGLRHTPEDTVNVLDWGAKGDGITDDRKAIQSAMLYCAANNKLCYIPRTKNFYLVKGTINVPLETRQSLTIQSDKAVIKPYFPFTNNALAALTAFKEKTVLSIGPKNLGKQAPTVSAIFDNNTGIAVQVSGLVIDGAQLPHTTVPAGFNAQICIGLMISAERITVTNCDFRNIFGNGMMAMGPAYFNCIQNTFDLVGGRGKTPYAFKVDNDQFGDAINISAVKNKGNITVDSCLLQGYVAEGRRSRCGITFNFSDHNYAADIKNCSISGYAKCIHVEEKTASRFNITGCDLKDFSYGIANVTNNGTVCDFTDCNIKVSKNDGQDAAGAALLGLNYKSNAVLNFYYTTIDFIHCGVYQSVAPVKLFDHCVFNANHLNLFFADADTLRFDHCTFNGFGGPKKSFYRCCNGAMNVMIKDSRFQQGGPVRVEDEKVRLQVINSPSIGG